jgi:hypothetical protein
MADLKVGSQVAWIKKMACVPHPEGKTDRDGNVLPVFRDTKMTGTIIEGGTRGTWWVRPNGVIINIRHSERIHDVQLNQEDIILG